METKTSDEVKNLVREKYAQIASQSAKQNAVSCCGSGACAEVDYSIFAEDYTQLEGYLADADLALGCGIPVKYAAIQKGDTVVDLGSGAGNDCFVARALTGETGKVIGVDMTPEMIEKARANTEKLGFKNVQFRLGEIEALPLAADHADVVVSNCVLNLVPDKEKAFSEIHRILKSGGHFCISDVVLKGALPDSIRGAAEMYAGCVSGALQMGEYLSIIHEAGFRDVTVEAKKQITVPDEILLNYLSEEELGKFHSSGAGIYSITVTASKKGCCEPGSGCC